MYKTVERLYANTKNKELVLNAVIKKHWISEADYERIVGEPFPSTAE